MIVTNQKRTHWILCKELDHRVTVFVLLDGRLATRWQSNAQLTNRHRFWTDFQTFIDTYSRVAFCKLYTERTVIVAADLLNDRVLPFFGEQGIALLRILTDRGTEYLGRVERHAYQLYLAVENIDHSKTKARSPQTNGICERFHRTIKEEFYDITLRKKLYHTVEELQIDLDHCLDKYNNQRPHSGRYCYGKTPMQTFRRSRHIAVDKTILNDGVSDSEKLIA